MSIAAREAEQDVARSPISYIALRIDRRGRRRRRGRREARTGNEGARLITMAQEIITLECTEAKALGKPVSRYMSSRDKKSPQTPNRLEKKKYNPFLRRHTLHRETR